MRALVFEGGAESEARPFEVRPLQATDLGSEAWLQRKVFEHPELLPIEDVDPGSGAVAPLCRELSLPRPQGPVYLDMLGVTRRGRLVLVECKLWRNPQARREVVGQILEYAALLKRLAYGDLSVQVAQKSGVKGPNPIWTLASERLGLSDEAAFVDAVSSSLSRGEFDLLVVGDGIRSEVDAVCGYLESLSGLRTRLALVEIRALWSDEGRLALVPQLAMRTQLVEHRMFDVASQSSFAAVEEPARETATRDPSPAAGSNRAFWQRFIDEARFDHPDQPQPSHGGNNWVRLPMPKPFSHAAAYRSASGAPYGRIGVFMVLKGDEGEAVFAGLQQDRELVQSAFDQPILLNWDDGKGSGVFAVDLYMEEPLTEDAQLQWAIKTSNAFVNLIRPRLTLAAVSA